MRTYPSNRSPEAELRRQISLTQTVRNKARHKAEEVDNAYGEKIDNLRNKLAELEKKGTK